MLRSSENVLAETNEPGNQLPEFKLINTGFAPGLERSDALSKKYEKFGVFSHREKHNNYILYSWLQLNDDWFVRSIYTDTLQLLDRSGKQTRFINIPHQDLQAMTHSNSADAMLTTLTTSCITEWKVDAAHKRLIPVRAMNFTPTLKDSESQKSSQDLKLEAVVDHDFLHTKNQFDAFEKIPGKNLHRYIASSNKRTPRPWDGGRWRDFVEKCATEDDKHRLINAKLYLFDLLNKKFLVIDFPKNAVSFTFLKPDLLAFNDLYDNGIWLCDIHFDAVTGPSIKPHAQQQTIALAASNCLLAGEDYWVELRRPAREPWYTLSKRSDVEVAPELKQPADESEYIVEEQLVTDATLPDETVTTDASSAAVDAEETLETNAAEPDVFDDDLLGQLLAESDAQFQANPKVVSDAKDIPTERPKARDIPEIEPVFDAEAASIKPVLEEKLTPDKEKEREKTRKEVNDPEEGNYAYRGHPNPGFNLYRVKFSKDQYTIQSLPCPEPFSIFCPGDIENKSYENINGSGKRDVLQFISHEKGIYVYQINMFIPSMNVMVRFPTSRDMMDCDVITSPDSYQFTVISERRKVIQTYRLPDPKLITVLDSALTRMSFDVVNIVRRYVQHEPTNFRELFKNRGLFSGKPKLPRLPCTKNSFSLHFLDLLETACLYIQSGIETDSHLEFRLNAPAALNNVEFNEFLAEARALGGWYRRGEDYSYNRIFKKAFYLFAGLMYVLNHCKLSRNADLEGIVDQAVNMLSNPEVRFRVCLQVGTSPDTYRQYCALANNGRNTEILSVVERMLRSTVKNAVKLAPQVEKEAEEDFANSLVLSVRRA